MTTELDTETTIEEPSLRIVRVASCPSLSGRSQLTYHVGCDESGAIHFRLWKNSAAGVFSNTWTQMKALSELLGKSSKITSASLLPEFEMTSRNDCGFTLALLVAEQLCEKNVGKDRTYRCCNPALFLERINALIASNVALKEDAPSDAESAVSAHTTAVVAKRGKAKKQAQ